MVFIFDLDDTLFPLANIDDNLSNQVRESLIKINESMKEYTKEEIDEIEYHLKIKPLDDVIKKYRLSDAYQKKLINKFLSIEACSIKYRFNDINFLDKLVKYDSYLVTTGFPKLQFSKLKLLGLESYFREVYIDNPVKKNRVTKAMFFKKIESNYRYNKKDFVVIGDNLNSEIKSANELGLTSIWINRNNNLTKNIQPTFTVTNLNEIEGIIKL